jgi:hypothetical protein
MTRRRDLRTNMTHVTRPSQLRLSCIPVPYSVSRVFPVRTPPRVSSRSRSVLRRACLHVLCSMARTRVSARRATGERAKAVSLSSIAQPETVDPICEDPPTPEVPPQVAPSNVDDTVSDPLSSLTLSHSRSPPQALPPSVNDPVSASVSKMEDLISCGGSVVCRVSKRRTTCRMLFLQVSIGLQHLYPLH